MGAVTMSDLRARAAGLSCWAASVDPQPLPGGITNTNFVVEDRGNRYVVRIGDDIPVHHIVRFNELAASRAAHAAGISPGVVHAEPGALVLEMIEGRSLTSADLLDRSTLRRVLDLLLRCHREVPKYLRGPVLAFWVFHVIRDYAATLEDTGSGHAALLPSLLKTADRLERATGPFELVFGHNDMLASNIIDDGSRLWLIDWDYAGFNSPLFDLGGLAANNELSEAHEHWMLEVYLNRSIDDALLVRYQGNEMRSDVARDTVEHGIGTVLQTGI